MVTTGGAGGGILATGDIHVWRSLIAGNVSPELGDAGGGGIARAAGRDALPRANPRQRMARFGSVVRGRSVSARSAPSPRRFRESDRTTSARGRLVHRRRHLRRCGSPSTARRCPGTWSTWRSALRRRDLRQACRRSVHSSITENTVDGTIATCRAAASSRAGSTPSAARSPGTRSATSIRGCAGIGRRRRALGFGARRPGGRDAQRQRGRGHGRWRRDRGAGRLAQIEQQPRCRQRRGRRRRRDLGTPVLHLRALSVATAGRSSPPPSRLPPGSSAASSGTTAEQHRPSC